MDELRFEAGPLAALAADVRAQRRRAVDVVEDALSRVDELGPERCGVVTVDAEGARRRASAIDRAEDRSGLELCGVPFTVKDTIETADLRTTAGSRDLSSHVPTQDAPVVASLRQAGAILIGKTNTPSRAGDLITRNAIFGETLNPWDATRTPGGSSGGGAAAVATGTSAFDVGSDHAGSLRLPAHYCGVSTHRPTVGLLAQRGHIPPGPNATAERDLMTLGPLAAEPADLAVLLEIMVEAGSPVGGGWRPVLRPVDPAGPPRVIVLVDDDHCPVDRATAAAVRAVADRLAATGRDVEEADLPAPLRVFDDLFGRLLGATIGPTLDDDRFEAARQVAASFSSQSMAHLARDARACTMTHREWLMADEERASLRRALAAELADGAVVICPVAPTTAPPLTDIADRYRRPYDVDGQARPYFDQIVWSSIASVTGCPATVVPVSHDDDGLPIGVQVIAAPFADLCAIATATEVYELGDFRPVPLGSRDRDRNRRTVPQRSIG